MCLLRLAIALLAATGVATALAKDEPPLEAQLQGLLGSSDRVALYAEDGRGLFSHGDGAFVPASTIKILTAQAALAQLGHHYRFATNLWLDEQQRLIVEGLGDPLLVSEEIALMAQQLVRSGHSTFAALALDTDAVDWQLPPGSENSTNPYDAPNGGLIVNFNTLHLKLAGGRVRSAEPQTPTIALGERYRKHLPKNTSVRLNLGFDKQLADTHTHQMIRSIFNRHGIVFASASMLHLDANPATAERILTYRNSQTLDQYIRAMLRFSNNHVANQLGLVMLLERNAPAARPATIAQAAQLVTAHAHQQLGMAKDQLKLAELSGLSRSNQITLQGMQRVLDGFAPHAKLMRSYNREAGISASGTQDIRAKSGTLRGIANLAGYIFQSDGMYSFIIYTSSNKNRDAILSLLAKLSLRYSL